MKSVKVKVKCLSQTLTYKFASLTEAENFANSIVNAHKIDYLPALNQFIVTC